MSSTVKTVDKLEDRDLVRMRLLNFFTRERLLGWVIDAFGI